MKYIEHIVEPQRLLLSWQTSQKGQSRTRMFVAELVRSGDDADLVYLAGTEELRRAEGLGFEGYPGFSALQQRHEGVLFAFMKRLPPRKRGDFIKYLGSFRIKPDAEISDFAMLGYSGARLPDDDFTIINPFENATPPFEFLLSIQGYRYYMEQAPFSEIRLEQEATFEKEPNNKIDPNAIKVLIGEAHAGYVCRGLTESFHKWLAADYVITANVERINGTEEHPEIYLYISVRKPV